MLGVVMGWVIGLGIAGWGCSGERDAATPPAPREAVREAAPSPPDEATPPRAASSPDDGSERPNVVLITLDTTRADALGIYGQSRPTSPRIDRMGREGVVFDRAVSSSPETLPSHATLFTGVQPYTHGVRENAGFVLSESNRTLAEVFAEEGYRTGAEIAALVLRDDTRIGQGFAARRDPSSEGVELKKVRLGTTQGTQEVTVQTRVGADITRRGIEFIERHRDEPFFLWLHYFDPHDPYSAPGRFNQRIPDSPYHAEVASADYEIGRVLDALEARGLRERTLVVLTSDHGEGLGEHGEPTHSYFVYDSTIRVPLIFWGLGALPGGTRIESLVRVVDVAPTILELAGAPGLGDVEGVSLVPLLSKPDGDLGLTAYGESTRFSITFGMSPIRYVRDGNWKYIHKVNPELYDLASDPAELRNLHDAHPEVAARLRTALEAMVASAPAAPDDATTAIDEATSAQLAALGYASSAPVAAEKWDTLVLEGADPNERMADVEQLSILQGHIRSEIWADAAPIASDLIERYPDNVYFAARAAEVSIGRERWEEAVARLGHLVDADDVEDIDAAKLLAQAYEGLSRDDEAIALRQAILERSPCDEPSLVSVNKRLHANGRFAEQMEVLERANESCADSAPTLNNHAWALATLPVDELRDGERAVEMARRAMAARGEDDPAYRDTLGAALAEAGDFAEATRVQQGVLVDLKRMGVPDGTIALFRAHLDAYRAQRPVRDPAD